MTFSIQQIKRTRTELPPRLVVFGPHKIGKTTLASCAPSPIFIRTEDGQENVDAQAFPLATKWTDIIEQAACLYQEPHDYKTAVLDSGDWAERLLHAHIVATRAESAKVKSIEDFGYGKGFVFASEAFVQLLDILNALRTERGMGIIILCHTEIKRFDDPLSAGYDRWQIKLHKQTGKLLQEWADAIGFASLDVLTTTETKADFAKTERVRALSSDRRVLRLNPSPAFDSGNRYGMRDVGLSWAEFQTELDIARGLKRLDPVQAPAIRAV